MEIKISGEIKKYIKDVYEILWKIHLKKTIVYLLVAFLMGVLFIITGLTSNHDTSISTTKYDENATSVIKNITYYKYHFTLGLGIAFSIFALYILFLLFNQRKRLIRSMARRKISSVEYSMRITENQISYEDPEFNRNAKWSIFWKYKIYKKNILLLRNEAYWESFIIPIDRISQNEYEIFLEFLKRTLPQKK